MRKREGERARDGGREEKQEKRGDRLYRTKLSKIGEREKGFEKLCGYCQPDI